ncbi:hypothetical protein H4R21_001952, partial [Coemansia helicoidea]
SQQSLLTQIGYRGTATPAAEAGPTGDDGAQARAPEAAAAAYDRHLLAPADRLESYAGEITRIVDPVLGIYVIDDAHLLILTRWPSLSPLFLAAAVVQRTTGLVQMIEALEAFWQLFAKFSAAPRPAILEDWLSPIGAAVRPIVHMALVLAGCRPDALFATPSRDDVCQQFLQHKHTCSMGRPVPGGPIRVVKLGDIIRLVHGWQKTLGDSQQQQQQPGDGVARQRSEQVRVTSISPSELGLEGVPLIGRLAVSARGCIYLQDDTGQIRACAATAAQPAFAGQGLVGHVCVWRSWRLVIEAVDVVPAVPDGGSLRKERIPLNLIYARLADPLAVLVDGSFGGSAGEDPLEERGTSCFLFVAHAQGLAMPLLDAQSSGETGTSWRAQAIAKGVGAAIAPTGLLPETLHRRSGPGSDETLLAGIGERDLQPIHIRCDFGATPVCFAPGAAYVVCVRSPARCREFSAALGAPTPAQAGVVVLDLERGDHVHPVQIATQQYEPPGLASVDAGLQDVSDEMPVVWLGNVQRLAEPPPVLSVGELADSPADAPGTERIVSVSGTILQREVVKSIVFNTASDAGRAVVGQLENRITLQDDRDGTQTVAIYVKLSSFSHPLGLVPGARVVFRDVVVSTSRSTGNRYLVGTAATSVDEAAALMPAPGPTPGLTPGPTPTPSRRPKRRRAATGEPVCVCIAELYAVPGLCGRRLEMHCYVDSVESVRLALQCTVCRQTVCSMGCSCARKQRWVVAGRGDPGGEQAGTARVDAELLCLVSDGSGIAWLTASREEDIACVLGLQPDELAGLYGEAAHAWNGRLLWRRQPRAAEGVQSSGASEIVARAAPAAAGARLAVDGAMGGATGDASCLPIRRQPLRMDGQSTVVSKRAPPTVVAARVARLATPEHCWRLLRELGSPG